MRTPVNVIVGFLGSGKTTAIVRLIEQKLATEKWAVLINEFGEVSVDHALVGPGDGTVEIEELGGGCACCTMSFVFQPLLARLLDRAKPDRLIVEPSGLGHPAKLVDMLRGPKFSESIDLRNIICLVDPQDAEDPRWRDSAVFQDQIQLADIVILNWTDQRNRELIDGCREWIESFRPPKQLILETSFGSIDPGLLDRQFATDRFPLFVDAHPIPDDSQPALPLLDPAEPSSSARQSTPDEAVSAPAPGRPLRYQNDGPGYDACGWIFHADDVFDRDELLDLLAHVHPIVRLKGVFRCEDDWWSINRAKDETSFHSSAYRRDSRVEITRDRKTSGWVAFEGKLLECLSRRSRPTP